MHPILFEIGDFPIGTYGVMIVIGMLTGMWLSTRLAQRRRISPDFIYDLAFVVMISGFIGGRLFYMLVNWDDVMADPRGVIFSRQGFVFYGGLIAATPAAIWFIRRRGLGLMEVADVAAPGIVIAHAFGRIGCFLSGCCYGKVCLPGTGGLTELVSVRYPLVMDASGEVSQMFNFAYWDQLARGLIQGGLDGAPTSAPLPIVPVQLFESFGNFLICTVLLLCWRRRIFSGQIFALYLAFYGCLRFGLELIRGDIERGLYFGGRISTSQIICLGVFAAAAVIWASRRRKGLDPLPDLAAESSSNPASTRPKPTVGTSQRRTHGKKSASNDR